MKSKDSLFKISRLDCISDYYESGLSISEFISRNSLVSSTFYRWIRNFERSNPLMLEHMKKKTGHGGSSSLKEVSDLKSEIARLHAELEHEKLRSHAYDVMIEVAEEMFNIPIRKKAGTKQ